jgi:hypothetical protein
MSILLSYASCNTETLILFCIILPFMIIAIMIMKLFVDGEIYKDRHGCWPISFYFGETHGCRRLLYKNINMTINRNKDKHKESFEVQNMNTNKCYYYYYHPYLYLKEFISDIVLKIRTVNKMVSTMSNEFIQMNEYISNSILSIFKEKISLSFT